MSTRRTTLLALLALVTTAGPSPAIEGDALWEHAYGGSAQERGSDMKVTDDGGFILTGYTRSFGASGTDVYLVKLDAEGVLEWDAVLGSAANDEGAAVIETPDGGYLVAGNQNIGTPSTTRGLIIKVDAGGQEQWQATYGGAGEDEFLDVVACADGGYALVGATTSIGPGGHVGWLVRVDESGGVAWEQTVPLDARGFDYLTALVETAEGDFVVSGYSGDGVTFPEYDAEMAALDAAGMLLWTQTFDESNYDRAYDITIAPDGGFAVAGPSASSMTIWRTDEIGHLEWRQRFSTVTGDFAGAVAATGDGGFLVAGDTWNYDDGAYQVYVGKTDGDGNALWERLYGGAGNEICQAIGETSDGNYAFAGNTGSSGSGGDDLLLLLVEGSGAVVGVGEPAPLVGQLTAYPNPFTPGTRLVFSLSVPSRATVDVLDAQGRRVRTLLEDAPVSTGAQTLRWDGRDDTGRRVAAGVYFVRMRAGQQSAKQKLLLLR